MNSKLDIEADNSHDIYAGMLRFEGVELDGANIMDVGAGKGDFVRYAKENLNAAESWGCDHCSKWVAQGFEDGTLEESDREKIIVSPFSKMLDRGGAG